MKQPNKFGYFIKNNNYFFTNYKKSLNEFYKLWILQITQASS